jgi:hypothetical protein
LRVRSRKLASNAFAANQSTPLPFADCDWPTPHLLLGLENVKAAKRAAVQIFWG